ncbi:MAG: carbohydrate ABC transporter permease [Phototrophicaceae bacterium]
MASLKTASKQRQPINWTPYLFMLIPLALYFTWIVYPTFSTFYLSLTNWDGVTPNPRFVGFANFERLFSDRDFHLSLQNNLRWLLIFITVPTVAGLFLAMIFNAEMVGGRFYKVSFFAPLVLSLPVIGLVWSFGVYNPQEGLLQLVATWFGNPDAKISILSSRQTAIWAVIAAAVWRQVGYVMVLYLAGLKNVDPSLVDAAQVDGADRFNLFFRVILPLLAPVTSIIVVISVIDSLRAFDLVSVMTRGGNNTQVLANFMYIEAFNNYKMGYGASIAVMLFLISFVFILFFLWRVLQDEIEA